METRRWFELAAAFTTALVLGVLIGYGVARSMTADVPERRYTVGAFNSGGTGYLFRYDPHAGKTWVQRASRWEEIAEPNQVVSPPNEKN
jgi:hypothetical protein